MTLELRYVTCGHCGSHEYSSKSEKLDENDKPVGFKMTCHECGEKSEGFYKVNVVPFPSVSLPDGSESKALTHELELFFEDEDGFPHGANVEIVTYDKARWETHSRFNITEFHYLYNSYDLDEKEKVAFESNLHGHGGNMPICHIKSIKITKAEKMEKWYYDMDDCE